MDDAEAASDGLPLVQLYDMKADPGEQTNRREENPGKVRELISMTEKIVADSHNDTKVDIWKLHTMPGVDPSALDDY